jgi:aminoglycoside phosphotransferase (APT) family kinase protein
VTAQVHRGIEQFLLNRTGAHTVFISSLRPLSGGVVHQNLALDVDIHGGPYAGQLASVLRADSPSRLPLSHTRTEEFALLKTAYDAGIAVPQPLWLCDDPTIIGQEFFVMRRLSGVTAPHRVVRDNILGGDRSRLVQRLGAELAKIHSVQARGGDLAFLQAPAPSPALAAVALYRQYIDGQNLPRPALEWALRWLEQNAPDTPHLKLCHGDYRTGNYLLDDAGLRGILDWEFASWGDPMEDVGWFCAKCWRFGADDKEAGGIGPREEFYSGYERLCGRRIDHRVVRYWEVMAHVKAAVIAILHAQREISGAERSLELALSGHVVPQLEWELLNMTREAEHA